jgi:hypothetical protein
MKQSQVTMKAYQIRGLNLEAEVGFENCPQMGVPLLGLHAQVMPDKIVNNFLENKVINNETLFLQ